MNHQFNWAVLWEYRELLLAGLKITIQLSSISIVICTVLGIILGIMRLARNALVRLFASAYVEFFVNTPLIIQMFFWYFALPMMLPETLRFWLWSHNYEFIASVIGLSIYTSSFIAEAVRAGIQAIDKGQREAALSTGLSGFQTMWYIILPQAVRIVIPPICNQYLNLIKNSSLAMTIAVPEITFQAQAIESYTFRGFEAFTAATLIYISLTLTVSFLMSRVERWASKGQRAVVA